MLSRLQRFIKEPYLRIINSIAFYPALILLLFFAFSYLSIAFDFSETGQLIKSRMEWLRLRDSSTARTIASTVATGIVTLTVFGFTMVMLVLNQTATQMSNRILNNLIGKRFHQIVLGFYIGTIVYALIMLSVVSDIDTGVHIPAFTAYILILLTIIDLFFFVYFLHYITQSVKFEVIIREIYNDTMTAMEGYCRLEKKEDLPGPASDTYSVEAERSGIYKGFNKNILLRLCDEYDCTLNFIHHPGTFILKGLPVFNISRQLPGEARKEMLDAVFLHESETISENYLYGFRQLSEVAVKALSPGVNDPGTAVLSLKAIFSLLIFRVCHYPGAVIRNKENRNRIYVKNLTYDELFSRTLLPVWQYGKNDPIIQNDLYELLKQLQAVAPNSKAEALMTEVLKKKISENQREF